jgi:hypothetical protein
LWLAMTMSDARRSSAFWQMMWPTLSLSTSLFRVMHACHSDHSHASTYETGGLSYGRGGELYF